MKHMIWICVSAVFILTSSTFLLAQPSTSVVSKNTMALHSAGISRTSAASYEIATWQGFRSAAVSYTFDDNCPNQLLIAVPMFDTFGFKLTLFTVTSPSWGWKANWPALQAAADEGHEIASHTIDHQPLGGMSTAQQQGELELSQDTINARITGHSCVTFAYPNCIVGTDTVVAQYYVAARGCSGQIVGSTPANFMNISSFVCGNQGLNSSADMESKAIGALGSKGWVVYLMHGINDNEPGAYSPISQDTIQSTLQFFSNHKDQYWVAPFGDVARYVQERNAANVSETFASSDSITASVSDNVAASYPRVPLTVRRPLPNGWDSVVVRQHGIKVVSHIVKVDTVLYVVFDAIPNAGNVTIKNMTGSSVGVRGTHPSPKSFGLFQNYPNPFNPTTSIKYQLALTTHVSLKIFDLLGREVAALVNEQRGPGDYNVTWDAHDQPSGVYLYRLRTGSYVETKKLVLMK